MRRDQLLRPGEELIRTLKESIHLDPIFTKTSSILFNEYPPSTPELTNTLFLSLRIKPAAALVAGAATRGDIN